jgi:hypothetical protein
MERIPFSDSSQISPVIIYDTGFSSDTHSENFDCGPFVEESFLKTPKNREILRAFEEVVALISGGEDLSGLETLSW